LILGSENARRKAQGKTPAPISPLAFEAVRRRPVRDRTPINGQTAEQRLTVRQELSAPLVADLESWMRQQRQRSRQSDGWIGSLQFLMNA